MWIHFVYLLFLPTLAVISAFFLFPTEEYWKQLMIVGFPAVLMYCIFLASGYAMPESLPVALVQVLLVPIQIAIGVALFGGGSVWLFFAESAAVEIGSFVLGVLWVALSKRNTQDSRAMYAFIVLMGTTCFVGGSLPHIVLVFYAYGGFSLWLVLFITAFATSFREHSDGYRKVSSLGDDTSKNLELRFDGGLLFMLLRIRPDLPLISPLWTTKDRTQINGRVHLFAWTAPFMPFVAGLVLSIYYRL